MTESATKSMTDDSQALIGIARRSVELLDKGHLTARDLRTDVVAMRSIRNRIDARLDVPRA